MTLRSRWLLGMAGLAAVLMVGLIPYFNGPSSDTRCRKADQDLEATRKVFELYRQEKGAYPTSEDGQRMADSGDIAGRKIGKDAWGHRYLYRLISDADGPRVSVVSLGAAAYCHIGDPKE